MQRLWQEPCQLYEFKTSQDDSHRQPRDDVERRTLSLFTNQTISNKEKCRLYIYDINGKMSLRSILPTSRQSSSLEGGSVAPSIRLRLVGGVIHPGQSYDSAIVMYGERRQVYSICQHTD